MENKDTLRITILGVLSALFFGIMSYIQDKKFDAPNIEAMLSVISKSVFEIGISFFILYMLSLGYTLLYSGSGTKISNKIKEISFDLSICIVGTITLMAILIFVVINLIVKYPGLNNQYFIWISFALILLFGSIPLKGIYPYIGKLFNRFLKSKSKISKEIILLIMIILLQLVTNYFLIFR